MQTASPLQGWSAGGHAYDAAWYELLARVGPWVVLCALGFLVARALLQAQRYRARAYFDAEREARVHAALRAAEQRTLGEIVPVILERSDAHPETHWRAALTFALTGSVCLLPHLDTFGPLVFLAAQIAFGSLGYLLSRTLPAFARLFLSEARATSCAQEQSWIEFHTNNLQATECASGVLIFVSLFERRVIVLADSGVAAHVQPEAWTAIDEAVLSAVRRGELADGLVDAIERAGALLAEHCPWREGTRNELPDRLIVRAQ